MTEREPSDLGVGDRRRYYQMGVEDGLQQAKEALTDEELLQEVVMRGLDYHRPLDEERLKREIEEAFKRGEASRMDWAVAFATEKAQRDIHRANLEAARNTTQAREEADRKAREDLLEITEGSARDAAPRQHPPFDIIAPPGKTWWEFWK